VLKVKPHIFSDALAKKAPDIQHALEDALTAVADQIVKEAQ